MELVDFTGLPKRNKGYGGADSSKIAVMFKGKQYMLKFPSLTKQNPNLGYSNSCFSEYLGCKIFNMLGIPAQETLLGTYTVRGKEKIVVACEDFTSPGIVLQDFGSLKNQMIDSEYNGYNTDLSEILQTFSKQTAIDQTAIENRFWDMFIVDAFIGNGNRHNDNWGFLYDTATDEITLAPVYGCSGAFYPQANGAIMRSVLTDKTERDYHIFEIPKSAIRENGNCIKYFDFISSLRCPGCNQALKRIGPRIDIEKIRSLIDATPALSGLQRDFYITMLEERKARILDVSLARLEKERKQVFQIETL